MNDFVIQFLLVVFYVTVDPTILGPRVLMVGDSNVGTGLIAGLTRQASLRSEPWELTPVSVSGSAIRHQAYWVPHLRTRVASTKPELVILNLGANDAIAEDFGSHWTELPVQALALLQEIPQDVPVIVVGVPPDISHAGGSYEGQTDWINLFAWHYALGTWGGQFRFVQPPGGLLGTDGVHYTDEGGRAVADLVYHAGCELLGEPAYTAPAEDPS